MLSDDPSLSTLEEAEIIVHMVYGEGKETKSTYDGVINVLPNIAYIPKLEVLRIWKFLTSFLFGVWIHHDVTQPSQGWSNIIIIRFLKNTK